MILTSGNPTTVAMLLDIDIFIDIFNLISFDMNVKQYHNYEKKLDQESSVSNVTLSRDLSTQLYAIRHSRLQRFIRS